MTKNLNKTIPIFFIVFILGCLMSGAISIQSAISNTEENLRHRLPPIASIEPNHEALSEHYDSTGELLDFEPVSAELLSQIGDFPQVEDYDISMTSRFWSSDLKMYSSDDESEEAHSYLGDRSNFELKGVHSSRLLELERGVIGLTSGRMFTEDEVTSLSYIALVSEEFARRNQLHIGSIFTLDDIIWDWSKVPEDSTVPYVDEHIYAQRSHDFEVVGIFVPLSGFDSGDEYSDAIREENILNRVFVPNPVTIESQIYTREQEADLYQNVHLITDNPVDSLSFDSIYILSDSRSIEDFKVAAEALLPDYWIVTDTGSSAFGGMAASFDGLSMLANGIFWIAASVSVLILSLLITLFVLLRRREIGIYLAVGERRIKVIAQIMLEVLMPSLFAAVLALIAGNMIAASISNFLLYADLGGNVITSFTYAGEMGFGGTEISTEEVLASYNVALNLATAGTFLIFVTGIIMIATTFPMIYILNLKPKKLLL
ncbi:MAG: ABC transporter permease [Coriobacteriia bacterium]|nr:ABC transporter permease [Coriobacteriia bacterium]